MQKVLGFEIPSMKKELKRSFELYFEISVISRKIAQKL
jgi:hypothetical protein